MKRTKETKRQRKPGLNEQMGRQKDEAAAKTIRAIDAAHEVLETFYVGPRMYKREVYGK